MFDPLRFGFIYSRAPTLAAEAIPPKISSFSTNRAHSTMSTHDAITSKSLKGKFKSDWKDLTNVKEVINITIPQAMVSWGSYRHILWSSCGSLLSYSPTSMLSLLFVWCQTAHSWSTETKRNKKPVNHKKLSYQEFYKSGRVVSAQVLKSSKLELLFSRQECLFNSLVMPVNRTDSPPASCDVLARYFWLIYLFLSV